MDNYRSGVNYRRERISQLTEKQESSTLSPSTPTFLPATVTAMDNLSWQQELAKEADAAKKEWMALERRYHLQLVSQDDETKDRIVRLFVSLSDPDLPTQLKGEVELQMTLPSRYPMAEPRVDFAQWSSRLSDEQIAALNAAVKAQAELLRGGFSLRRLLTWIDNNFVRITAPLATDIQTELPATENVSTITASEKMTAQRIEEERPAARPKKNRTRKPCRFFARGNCREGEKCKFSHDKQPKEPKTAADASAETAEVDASVVRDADPTQTPETPSTPESVAAAAPKKKKRRPRMCKFFAQNKCRDGDKCKFSHETKASAMADKDQKQQLELPVRGVVVELGVPSQTSHDEESITSAEPSPVSALEVHEDGNEWSETQQRALDLALKKYPATMDKKERWTSIADDVDGRSLNECIDRFKMLCDLVRRGLEPVAESVTAPAAEDDDEFAASTDTEDHGEDPRITPADQRVVIETEPELKGTQVSLEELFLHEIGTLVPHRLVCQIQCDNCPLKFDAILSLDASQIQKWCPRCSVLHHVAMRPVFAHSQSNVLAYIDTENCSVVDVLPSDVLATCLNCGCEALLTRMTPRQRAEQACFSCHTKLAAMTKRYVAGQLTSPSSKANKSGGQLSPSAAKATKKGAKQVVEIFVLGQPLPRNGACDHYKHSLRWFRFQCCGKAFPCDVCHDSSDCPQANLGKFASRMICGLCSKEQSSAVKVCACGNDVAAKKSTSRHWEGGAGCRNVAMMSRWDKQKYRGQNKTESKKFKRVGTEAKVRRENANE
ncbi:hypothetical protein BBJ28_00008523 [Nothophytophthora sp. Chile5]|nr:hypothetical protein BBJ28_00008523 [Nothophytophthora sp. Chile5]